LKGDFANGLPEYEWRWKTGQVHPQKFPQPHWRGNRSIAGETILLHGEQGFGDIIMMLRYIPQIIAMNAKVIVAVPPPVIPLLTHMEGAVQVFGPNENLPPFDCHCPFMSVPLALQTTLETVAAESPYLKASPDRVAKWGSRLGATSGLRIGIVWSGSTIHKNDHNRSIELRQLAPLFSSSAQFVSLQKEIRRNDWRTLQEHAEIVHLGEEINDFADSAALISLMDIVISVDTSVAHLAGALGKPVWILLPYFPDWRWLLDREDSPWYPTARLFRQLSPGDWDSVIARVREELRLYAT
jgi:hypothetical protein